MSAHIFIADGYYGYDDALFAAVRILSILQRSAADLAAFHDALPSVVNTPEIRVPCPEERKQSAVAEIKARLAAAGADVNAIDGVRVQRAQGWWLLRASNTQDVLVVRCESTDAEGLEELVRQVRAELRASGLDLPPWP